MFELRPKPGLPYRDMLDNITATCKLEAEPAGGAEHALGAIASLGSSDAEAEATSVADGGDEDSIAPGHG